MLAAIGHDLRTPITALVDDLADQGRDATFSVEDGLEKTNYDCRPLALRRVLHNLIENALRYAGQARVRLAQDAKALHIMVEDDGPGIPEEHLEQVFEPFVRLEESRSQDTGGVGLGLAIARSIAHAHGGDLQLVNRPKGGLRATLILPLDTP